MTHAVPDMVMGLLPLQTLNPFIFLSYIHKHTQTQFYTSHTVVVMHAKAVAAAAPRHLNLSCFLSFLRRFSTLLNRNLFKGGWRYKKGQG